MAGADGGGGGGVLDWAAKMKKLAKAKNAEKKEDEFDEIEAAATTAAAAASKAAAEATSTAANMLVGHDMGEIAAGEEVILTLQDARMLDKDGNPVDDEDVLECGDLVSANRRNFNEQRTKGFNKYDDAQNSSVLAQYDEERNEFDKSRVCTSRPRTHTHTHTHTHIHIHTHRKPSASEPKAPWTPPRSRRRSRTRSLLPHMPRARRGTCPHPHPAPPPTPQHPFSHPHPPPPHRYSLTGDDDKFTWNAVQKDTFTEEEMASFKKPKKKRVVRRKKTDAEVAALAAEVRREAAAAAETDAPARRIRRDADEDESFLDDALRKIEKRCTAADPAAAAAAAAAAAPSLSDLDQVLQAVAESSRSAGDDSASAGGSGGLDFAGVKTINQAEEGEEDGGADATAMSSVSEFAKKVVGESEHLREEAADAAATAGARSAEKAAASAARAAAEGEVSDERRALLSGVLKEETTASTLGGALKFIQEKGLLGRAYAGRANDSVRGGADEEEGYQIRRVDQYVTRFNFVFFFFFFLFCFFVNRIPKQHRYGRELTMEEAYRQHSYAYHGKQPSKKSSARMERRWTEQGRLRTMSDKDTSFGSAAGIARAQAETGAGVVLPTLSQVWTGAVPLPFPSLLFHHTHPATQIKKTMEAGLADAKRAASGAMPAPPAKREKAS